MVARRFLTGLLELDAAGAFDSFSSEAKSSVTRGGLVDMANALRKELEPRDLTVDRADLVRIKGHAPDRVVCARDLSRADGWESVKVSDLPQQAHVLLSAASRKERVAMVVWLIPEDAIWKVQGFSVNRATSGRKNALQLYELAKSEREGGRLFNATLLLAAAGAMAERGPYYQMGVSQAIRTEQATLAVPVAITGKPPWSWNGKVGQFTILGLGPLSVAGKIVVAIDYDVPSGLTTDEMVQANNKLLADFKARFPEYARVFSGTVVRAHLHGTDRGYASVDEVPEPR